MLADAGLTHLVVNLASVAGASGDAKVWAYAGFIALVCVFLALDLGVFHRHAHVVSMREALTWSVVWLTCGLAFAGFVYVAYERHWLGLGLNVPMYASGEGASIVRGEVRGADAATQYLTGYVVEKSLAMDNIFVIAMLFSFFAVPGKYQHRVLFWGILGALVMRGGMIFVGAELVMRYTWILIFFGVFLLGTALKMALLTSETDPSKNVVVRLMRRWLPLVPFYDGQKFLTRRTVPPTYSIDPATGHEVQDPPPAGTLSARWSATPLMLALVMVEVTDLIFAVDSIPAVFAVTPDPFIVFTSNVFAILGLRSLYFCLAAMIAKFRYLKPALVLILAFVGVKLLLLAGPPYVHVAAGWFGVTMEPKSSVKVDTMLSLMVIVGLLAGAVALSVLRAGRERARAQQSPSSGSPAGARIHSAGDTEA